MLFSIVLLFFMVLLCFFCFRFLSIVILFGLVGTGSGAAEFCTDSIQAITSSLIPQPAE